MKRFCCLIISFLLVAVPFFGQLSFNVYAYDVDNWPALEDIDHNDLTDAFLAYCRARDITIEGSVTDAVTSFTSGGFQSACKLLGIDMYQLQAEIKKAVDPDSNRLKYFVFTQLGITGFNRVCAQFLTDYNLQVGDDNVNKTVYSGELITDDQGYNCLVYYCDFNNGNPRIGWQSPSISTGAHFIAYGSVYRSNGQEFYLNNFLTSTPFICYFSNSETYTAYSQSVGYNHPYVSGNNSYKYLTWTNSTYGSGTPYIYVYDGTYNAQDSQFVVFKDVPRDRYWFGIYGVRVSDGYEGIKDLFRIFPNQAPTPADVVITSPVIKPDLPEDPCNIAPDGNVSPTDQDPSEPTPGGKPPSWDLGQDVEPDGDGGFKLPFSLPDLDIDWSISGLQNKFPFSIPFDIYKLCSILNATPAAPHFTGELDLKLYTWEIDIDLSEFDGMARILRIMELIGFVIGLAFVTRYMIKG